MAGKQAKILSNDRIDDLLAFAETTRQPLRNKLMIFLSAKAGLRAGEIANLTWDMVTDRPAPSARLCNCRIVRQKKVVAESCHCTTTCARR
jgi:site-specific recombinase XerD